MSHKAQDCVEWAKHHLPHHHDHATPAPAPDTSIITTQKALSVEDAPVAPTRVSEGEEEQHCCGVLLIYSSRLASDQLTPGRCLTKADSV